MTIKKEKKKKLKQFKHCDLFALDNYHKKVLFLEKFLTIVHVF